MRRAWACSRRNCHLAGGVIYEPIFAPKGVVKCLVVRHKCNQAAEPLGGVACRGCRGDSRIAREIGFVAGFMNPYLRQRVL